jgi:hypothetical protein
MALAVRRFRFVHSVNREVSNVADNNHPLDAAPVVVEEVRAPTTRAMTVAQWPGDGED